MGRERSRKVKMTYSDETALKALKNGDEKAYSWIYIYSKVNKLRKRAKRIIFA
jgi:hypothetical protein